MLNRTLSSVFNEMGYCLSSHVCNVGCSERSFNCKLRVFEVGQISIGMGFFMESKRFTLSCPRYNAWPRRSGQNSNISKTSLGLNTSPVWMDIGMP